MVAEYDAVAGKVEYGDTGANGRVGTVPVADDWGIGFLTRVLNGLWGAEHCCK